MAGHRPEIRRRDTSEVAEVSPVVWWGGAFLHVIVMVYDSIGCGFFMFFRGCIWIGSSLRAKNPATLGRDRNGEGHGRWSGGSCVVGIVVLHGFWMRVLLNMVTLWTSLNHLQLWCVKICPTNNPLSTDPIKQRSQVWKRRSGTNRCRKRARPAIRAA